MSRPQKDGSPTKQQRRSLFTTGTVTYVAEIVSKPSQPAAFLPCKGRSRHTTYTRGYARVSSAALIQMSPSSASTNAAEIGTTAGTFDVTEYPILSIGGTSPNVSAA